MAIFVSGWCWGAESRHVFTNETLHTGCVAIWAMSGLGLALSQVVFLIVAARLKPEESPRGTAARPEFVHVDRTRRARVIILVIAGAILAVLALFVFALSRMPS